jgi:predicted metal-dependent peptidase
MAYRKFGVGISYPQLQKKLHIELTQNAIVQLDKILKEIKMFTQSDLVKVVKELTLRVPQVEPFFFVIPFEIVEQEVYAKTISPTCTAAVSAKRAAFCDTFIGSLPRPKQLGLVLHEILHPALNHLSDPFIDHSISRAEFKQLANRAQDFVIENLICEISEAEAPNIAPEKRSIQCNYEMGPNLFRFKGMGWRQVYEILRSEREEGDGNGGEFDTHENGEVDVGDEAVWQAARKESEQIQEDLAKGSDRGAGDIAVKPAPPVVVWQDILQSYLTSLPAPVRKTWSRVKRRPFTLHSKYEPTRTGSIDALNHIYLLVDTSGSMHEWLPKAAGDLLNLFKVIEVGSVEIIYYDVGIQGRVALDHDDLADYKIESMPGGGGTCVNLALEELSKDSEFDADAPIVVLTDGYDDYRIGNLEVGPLVWLSYAEKVQADRGLSLQVTL